MEPRNLILAFVLFASLAHAQGEAVISLYQHAKTAEASGDYKSAAADYEKIIHLRPEMAEAYANAGNLYYLQGETQRAATYFRKAASLKPGLPGPHFFLGVLSFKARAYRDALKSLEQAEKLDPSNELIESYLGYTHFALHDDALAASYLEKAGNQEPKDIDVFYHLSKAYANLAKDGFHNLEARFPDSFYTALATAHVYEAQQNWDMALQQYQRAAERRPSDARLRQKLKEIAARKPSAAVGGIDGSLLLFYHPPAGDKVREALKDYQERARELRGRNAQSAEALYQKADNDQALSYLASQWVFEIDPDSYRAHQLKGQYYEESNNDEQAVAEYRKALELNPRLPNVHFLIGNLYWRREKPDQALPELRKELELDPSHPQALYEVGDILFAKGEKAEAERSYRKALQFEPEMEEAHLALERIYTERGQYEKAVIHLRKAAEIDPKDPTPHYRLARLYQQMGKPTASKAELELFTKLKREQPAHDRR